MTCSVLKFILYKQKNKSCVSYRWHTPNRNFRSIEIAHSRVTVAITKTRVWPWTKNSRSLLHWVKNDRYHTKLWAKCRAVKTVTLFCPEYFIDAINKIAVVFISMICIYLYVRISQRPNMCLYCWRSMQYNQMTTVNSPGLSAVRTTNVLKISKNIQR